MTLESSEYQQNIAKQERWNQVSTYIDKLHDRLGQEIDPGIRSILIALRSLGFGTTASCEGHLDHGLKGPWVQIGKIPDSLGARLRKSRIEHTELDKNTKAEIEEVNRLLLNEQIQLMDLLSSFYEDRNVPFGMRLILKFSHNTARLINQGTELQDGFLPEQQAANLQLYRQEMESFMNFLKEQFFTKQTPL